MSRKLGQNEVFSLVDLFLTLIGLFNGITGDDIIGLILMLHDTFLQFGFHFELFASSMFEFGIQRIELFSKETKKCTMIRSTRKRMWSYRADVLSPLVRLLWWSVLWAPSDRSSICPHRVHPNATSHSSLLCLFSMHWPLLCPVPHWFSCSRIRVVWDVVEGEVEDHHYLLDRSRLILHLFVLWTNDVGDYWSLMSEEAEDDEEWDRHHSTLLDPKSNVNRFTNQ